jgi:hypothetical protein
VEAVLERGAPLETRHTTLPRLAVKHATDAAAEVCDFAFYASGGAGIRRGVLQRTYRDMTTGGQHRHVSDFMLRECAKDFLGRAEGKVWTSFGLLDPSQV